MPSPSSGTPDREVLIQHLSKEIEVASAILVAQRTKNNLLVALGPFVLLGSLFVRPDGMDPFNRAGELALAIMAAVFVACYGVMGYMSARIEAKIWDKCNAWRELIADLTGQPRELLTFPSTGLHATYVGIYMSIALFVAVAVWVIRRPV